MEVSSGANDGSAGTDLEREALKRKRRIEAMRQLKEQQQDPGASQESVESHKLPRYSSISKRMSERMRD